MENKAPKQVWFVAAMAALLLILVAVVRLSQESRAQAEATPDMPTASSVAAAPTETATASPGDEPTEQASPSPALTNTPSPTVTRTPLPTSIPTAMLSPTPAIRPTDAVPDAEEVPASGVTSAAYVGLEEHKAHYWLIRPVAEDANDRVSRTYPYGSRMDGTYPVHHGVEFVNPMGTPLRAVADGTIVVAGGDQTVVYGARDDFYGQLIVLKLDQQFQGEPVYALYGHVSEIDVRVGQRVSTGDLVGLVGMSGVAEGPHVHFEVRIGENDYEHTVNPELWVKPVDGYGTLAGVLLDSGGALVDDEARLIITAVDGSRRYETTTYPAGEVNPDPGWEENFCIGDLPAGAWNVQVFHNNRLLEEVVQIVPGEVTWLELR